MNNENKTAMPQLPPDAILSQMLFGGLMQQSISIAAKFGIADLLVEKPQTVEELAAETETHAPSLYRVLRLLASVGIFSETADQKFELTPIADLLRQDAPNSMRDVRCPASARPQPALYEHPRGHRRRRHLHRPDPGR